MQGQLNSEWINSEWIYEVIVSPKMPTKNFKDFCPGSLLEVSAEILEIFGWHSGRNDDLINSFWITLSREKKQKKFATHSMTKCNFNSTEKNQDKNTTEWKLTPLVWSSTNIKYSSLHIKYSESHDKFATTVFAATFSHL